MTQEGAVPPSYNEYIRRVIREEIANYARSGSSRNMSIGEGGRLTIKGGQLRVLYPAEEGGALGVYVGDIFNVDSGVYRGTGLLVQDADGTDMAVFRTEADTGTTMVNLYDSGNRVIVGNDADSGQGLARPYVGGAFYRARYADWLSTTSATFETVWRGEIVKQHPKLSVATRSSMDTAGTTGEVRVMVDGVQLGVTEVATFVQDTTLFGPAAVAGTHMKVLTVEIQARVTSGTGALKIEPLHLLGRQS